VGVENMISGKILSKDLQLNLNGDILTLPVNLEQLKDSIFLDHFPKEVPLSVDGKVVGHVLINEIKEEWVSLDINNVLSHIKTMMIQNKEVLELDCSVFIKEQKEDKITKCVIVEVSPQWRPPAKVLKEKIK
jgi:hypothetical protein